MSGLNRLRGGVQIRNDRTSRYQRLEDLLGGDYLLNVDSYLIDDEYYGDKIQNDLQHPNRRVGVGERYGYDYDLDYSSYGAWVLADLHSTREAGLYGYVGGPGCAGVVLPGRPLREGAVSRAAGRWAVPTG